MSSRTIAAAFGAVGLVFAASTADTWTAQLEPQEGSSISGDVRVEAAAGATLGDTAWTDTTRTEPTDTTWNQDQQQQYGDQQLRVSITLMGLEEGKSYAWFLRRGQCGMQGHDQDRQQEQDPQNPDQQHQEKGDILGDESAYQPISGDSRSSASASAIIRASLQEGGQYHAAVHDGDNKSDKVVACGNLRSATEDVPATPPASPPGGN